MDIEMICILKNQWDLVTEDVIQFKDIDIEKLRELLYTTCEILEKYSKDVLVPKEISALLLEMNGFVCWVGDLPETPLNPLYQQLSSAISAMNIGFLYKGFEDGKARNLIACLGK